MDKYHGSPADRGSADAYYYRPADPHKHVNSVKVKLTDPAEIAAYYEAYYSETDRKVFE